MAPNQRGGHRARRGHQGERIDPSITLHSESSASVPEVHVESGTNSNVRGITCGKRVRRIVRNAKDRLRVEFNFKLLRAICDNAEAFNNEIGYIVRKNCTLQYKDWRVVPEQVKQPLREKLLTVFDINITDKKIKKLIDHQMGKAVKAYKYKLRGDYINMGGDADPVKAKSTPPDGVTKENWDYLCDLWSDDSFKELAKKKAECRAKRNLMHVGISCMYYNYFLC